MFWLVDAQSTKGLRTPENAWLVPLVAGPAAALLLFLPPARRRLSLGARSWAAGCCSLALTVWALPGGPVVLWGSLEPVCLAIMLGQVCRSVARPFPALALGAAIVVSPARMGSPDALWIAFALTFVVGAAVGIGSYLRVLDTRRTRGAEAVRQRERLELARNLHDLVAHHVTGILMQANAARAVRESAPEQIDPILRNIQLAGAETLNSMRQLVRVLREVDGEPQRSGEMVAELASLVSDFCGDGTQDATLSVTAPVRSACVTPEVRTAAHRVVRESLTNVRRHAPGERVVVRVDVAAERLRLEVHNTLPEEPPAAPTGGRSGFGILGLHERMPDVDGTLQAGPVRGNGWLVAATFPVLAEAGSSR